LKRKKEELNVMMDVHIYIFFLRGGRLYINKINVKGTYKVGEIVLKISRRT